MKAYQSIKQCLAASISRMNKKQRLAQPLKHQYYPSAFKPMQWRISMILIIAGALMLLATLSITQAYQCLEEAGESAEGFRSLFVNRMALCTVLVMSAAVFLSVVTSQDYQVVMDRLFAAFTPTALIQAAADGLETTASGLLRAAAESPEPAVWKAKPLTSPTVDDLITMTHSVAAILEEKEIFQEQISLIEQQARDSFIVRLLKGWVRDEPASLQTGIRHSLDLSTSEVQVLLFGRVDQEALLPDEPTQAAYRRLKQTMHEQLEVIHDFYVVEVDGLLALLLLLPPKSDVQAGILPEELLESIKLVIQLVYENESVLLRASIGPVMQGIYGIARSFAEALDLLQFTYLVGADSKVITYRERIESPHARQDDQERIRLEALFVSCIESGDFEAAEQLFQSMLDSSYRLPPVTDSLRYRLLGLSRLMVGALEQAQAAFGPGSLDVAELIELITSSSTLPALGESAQAVFAKLRSLVIAAKSQACQLRMSEIADFVGRSYQDYNLSVAAVARHFSLNPSYLSRTFKRMMGTGLASYIQQIRVDAAKELLRDKSISVKKAAELVGFGNVLTMNRAFRRQEGTTAGQLRQLLGE